MALVEKDLSEHIELLSDAAIDDLPHVSISKKDDDRDPLVEAALAEHQQQHQSALAGGVIDDALKNTFRVPSGTERIRCGISWMFVDDDKLIEMDLVVTALDTHSFEMSSVDKDHKKLFKKSIVYNKNKKNKHNKDDKVIDVSLDTIPPNCHSLWFRINALSGNSLKDVDKALFTIYGDDADEENSGNGDDQGNAAKDDEQGGGKRVLHSSDIGMGFDCTAILVGVLYRSPEAQKDWIWTVVEEKSPFDMLITNNLHLFYDDRVIQIRPNQKEVKSVLTKCGDQYIVHQSVEKLMIGLGWELNGDGPHDEEAEALKKGGNKVDRPEEEDAVKMVENQNKKNRAKKEKENGIELDIDVDGSVLLFGRSEVAEDEKICDLMDIVNNNNHQFKNYVEYKYVDDDRQQHDDDDDEEDVTMDEERFAVDLNRLNADNDVEFMCILINIFNDSNVINKDNTNNITHCHVRLLDASQNGNEQELCRFEVSNFNDDRKTTALALGYLKKLENGCWALLTNDVPLKKYSKIASYEEYAKQVVLEMYDDDGDAPRGKCCACTVM